ncbi:MAG: hypothetical protein ACRC46_06435 [Thermoguttaceae bacterium]
MTTFVKLMSGVAVVVVVACWSGLVRADVLSPPAADTGGASLGAAFSVESQDANQSTCDKNPQEGGPDDKGTLLERQLSPVEEEPRFEDNTAPDRAVPAQAQRATPPQEQFYNNNPPTTSVVPAPATLVVVAFGALGVAGMYFWRRNREIKRA